MANMDQVKLQMDAQQMHSLLGDLVTVVEPGENNKINFCAFPFVSRDHIAKALGCSRGEINVIGGNGVVRKLEISPETLENALTNDENRNRIALQRIVAQQMSDEHGSEGKTNIHYQDDGAPGGFRTYFTHAVTADEIAKRLGCEVDQVTVQKMGHTYVAQIPESAAVKLRKVAGIVQNGLDYLRKELPIVSFGLVSEDAWTTSIDLNPQTQKLSAAMDPELSGAAFDMCIRHLIRAAQAELGFRQEKGAVPPSVEGVAPVVLQTFRTSVSLIPPSVTLGPG